MFLETGRQGGTSKFRSVNEFIPHAIWLYQNANVCMCKYCQRMPQKQVTKSHAPGVMQASHGTPTPSRFRPGRPKNMRETAIKRTLDKVYASVLRAPIPAISKSLNVHPKATMLVERNSDLRAVSSNTAMKLRRWFRTGEVLWCALSRPIEGPNHTVIHFWPGLVDEVKLRTKPVSRTTLAATRPPMENVKEEGAVADGADDVTPWTISQSTDYRMRLLAANHEYIVSDDQVLPYQAHVPSDALIDALKAFPIEHLNFDRNSLSNFNPCPKEGSVSFEDAVATYAMAVQIASVISSYWCLTDEWAFEYHLTQQLPPRSISSPPPPKSTQPPAPTFSLSEAIQTAGQHNEQANLLASLGSSSSSGPAKHQPNGNHYPNVTAPVRGLASSDTQRLSARVLGKMASPPMPNTPPLTQMRFQGMWWGAERIWTDEFVRLKVPRQCIAPLGTENILPPSGPGKSVRIEWEGKGRDINEVGAGTRGVFMRMDGLLVVDAVQNDGSTTKEVRASGMLYELADIDWEEDPTTNFQTEKQNTAPITFVPGLSPLNPHILPHPNTEPIIPVATQPQQPLPSTFPPTSQQSHPSRPHYILPEAPAGYKFRAILTEGHEAVVSLSFISGRYYPKILSHPLMERMVTVAIGGPLHESNNLWALEGLAAGFHNSVDPIHYKPSRKQMVEAADRKSKEDLEDHKQQRIKALGGEGMEEDVDELGYPEAMDIDTNN
ncbi:hypothetical protein C0991_004769 [Blastosporella zonata]|nr:hypothetical protein C0991_004769 [Blastosporella zonata]